jgi:hypothetical protein
MLVQDLGVICSMLDVLRTEQENSQEICQLITTIFIIYKLLSLILTNKYFTQYLAFNIIVNVSKS